MGQAGARTQCAGIRVLLLQVARVSRAVLGKRKMSFIELFCVSGDFWSITELWAFLFVQRG